MYNDTNNNDLFPALIALGMLIIILSLGIFICLNNLKILNEKIDNLELQIKLINEEGLQVKIINDTGTGAGAGWGCGGNDCFKN